MANLSFYVMMAETYCSRCLHSVQSVVFALIIKTYID